MFTLSDVVHWGQKLPSDQSAGPRLWGHDVSCAARESPNGWLVAASLGHTTAFAIANDNQVS